MGSSFSEAFIAFFFANRTHRDRETHRESDKERRVCERRDFSLIQREIEEIVKYTINERERERWVQTRVLERGGHCRRGLRFEVC